MNMNLTPFMQASQMSYNNADYHETNDKNDPQIMNFWDFIDTKMYFKKKT